MRYRIRTLLILVSIIPLPFVFGPALINWATGFDTEAHSSFKAIEYGQPFETAIELLGEPYEKTDFFPRSLATYQSNYTAEEVGRCDLFMTWRNGINWFYSIGIDDDGKIVLKVDGHS